MGLTHPIALLALTAEGGRLARQIQTTFPGSEVYGLTGRVTCFRPVARLLRFARLGS